MTGRPRIYRAGIVALLAAYACFAWPGLYHLAAHVLKVGETLEVGPWTIHRAWLYPAAVDGGIFVAGCILLTQPQLVKRLRRELWAGMWTVAGLSGLGLVVDTLAKGVGWATPLILAPVVIATWFLHMVVRVQSGAAEKEEWNGEDEGREGRGAEGVSGGAAGTRLEQGQDRDGQVPEGEPAGDRRREERPLVPAVPVGVTNADGSDVHDPDSGSSAPDSLSGLADLVPAVAASPGNGHATTKVAKAVATVAAYRTENGGRLPSRPELASLAGVSESTARDALALTREK